VIAKVLTGARLETRAAQERIERSVGVDARPSEREIRPRRQKDAAAHAWLFLEQRQCQTPSGGIADQRHTSRSELSRERAIRRASIIDRCRKRVLWSKAVVRNERRHGGSRGDLPDEVPVGAGSAEHEAAAV